MLVFIRRNTRPEVVCARPFTAVCYICFGLHVGCGALAHSWLRCTYTNIHSNTQKHTTDTVRHPRRGWLPPLPLRTRPLRCLPCVCPGVPTNRYRTMPPFLPVSTFVHCMLTSSFSDRQFCPM